MDENKENNSSLPAPTTDVKIRTMNSDLQSMGLGGGIPQVSVQQIPAVDLNPTQQPTAPVVTPTSSGNKKIIYIILSIAGIAILFVLGFFLPKLLFGNQTVAPKTTPEQTAGPKATSTQSQQSTTTQTAGFVHFSFFKTASSSVTSITLSGNLTTESVSNLIAQQTAPISTSFSEMTFNKDGQPLIFKDFMNIYGWNFLPESFFTDNFQGDFTSFVYKNALGTYPGYVLQLKPDAAIVLLRSQLLKIESDPSLVAKIFLSSPTNPAKTFADSQVGGQPVRTLKFASGETFYYGWFNNQYLVLSASEEGLTQAFAKL